MTVDVTQVADFIGDGAIENFVSIVVNDLFKAGERDPHGLPIRFDTVRAVLVKKAYSLSSREAEQLCREAESLLARLR